MAYTYRKGDAFWAVLSFLAILDLFYFVQVLGMQSLTAPFSFILDKWYYLLILALGFAIQMVLYRNILKKNKEEKVALTASTSTSTGAMIACCTHNLALILPFAGLSALGNFLFEYIDYIFVFAIIVMVYSVYIMNKQYTQLHSNCITN